MYKSVELMIALLQQEVMTVVDASQRTLNHCIATKCVAKAINPAA